MQHIATTHTKSRRNLLSILYHEIKTVKSRNSGTGKEPIHIPRSTVVSSDFVCLLNVYLFYYYYYCYSYYDYYYYRIIHLGANVKLVAYV